MSLPVSDIVAVSENLAATDIVAASENLAATDIVAVSEVSIMIKRFGKQQKLVTFVQLFLKKQLGIINSPDYNSSYRRC